MPSVKEESFWIKIYQQEYENGLVGCKKNLRGRPIMNKGDKPYTTKDLITRLNKIWKIVGKWEIVSLGKGFYKFNLAKYDDLRMAWATSIVNIKPVALILSQLMKDFNYYTQKEMNTHIWTKLIERDHMNIRDNTLFFK